MNIMIVFFVGLVFSGGYNYITKIIPSKQLNASVLTVSNNVNSSEILQEFLARQEIINMDFIYHRDTSQYTQGVFSVFVNEIAGSGSFGYGILNGINKIVFQGRIVASVTIFVLAILSLLFSVFIANLFVVGRNRYFLEHRRYRKTKFDRLFFVYQTRTAKNVALIMFLRSVKQILWNFTIIGGIIKYYEYLMIPYILAENPKISVKDAFALSKQLMLNNKWNAFKIHLSLFPWLLLDFVTLRMISLFFVNPYRECIFAEVYMNLRHENSDSEMVQALLFDSLLDIDSVQDCAYPDSKCPTRYIEHRQWLIAGKDIHYSIDTIILFFFLISISGWIWEVCLELAGEGVFVNRGTLYGPWLPIYGVGGVLVLLVLRPLKQKPFLMFSGAVAICGVVEYFTAWLLEILAHKRWWDYTGYFGNLHGRICLEGLLVFGLAGIVVTYFTAPIFDNIVQKLSSKAKIILCIILICFFIADLGYSIHKPNIGKGITTECNNVKNYHAIANI